MRILNKVDKSLVEAHLTRLLQVDRSLYTLLEKEDASRRILEIVDVLTHPNGEAYAQGIKNLIAALQDGSPRGELPLFESIVEDVLTHVRSGQSITSTSPF